MRSHTPPSRPPPCAMAGYMQTQDQAQAMVAQVKTLTVERLKVLLRTESLPVSGVKSELQIRTIARMPLPPTAQLPAISQPDHLQTSRNCAMLVTSPASTESAGISEACPRTTTAPPILLHIRHTPLPLPPRRNFHRPTFTLPSPCRGIPPSIQVRVKMLREMGYADDEQAGSLSKSRPSTPSAIH